MTSHEYREYTITEQVCTDPTLGEGDIITVEIGGEEERFESLQEAKDYLDELADECEAREEREHQYWVRTGHRPGFWF